ncbi:MAG: hypothetical protein HFI11_07955 [Lachnospiraceae bacterium]|nr:hypothetical protein [Lachnospiraceae bacterium]
MAEIRGEFCIAGKEYILFMEKRVFKTRGFLGERKENSLALIPVPIKISTSTLREEAGYWLRVLKRYLFKKSHKKRT